MIITVTKKNKTEDYVRDLIEISNYNFKNIPPYIALLSRAGLKQVVIYIKDLQKVAALEGKTMEVKLYKGNKREIYTIKCFEFVNNGEDKHLTLTLNNGNPDLVVVDLKDLEEATISDR